MSDMRFITPMGADSFIGGRIERLHPMCRRTAPAEGSRAVACGPCLDVERRTPPGWQTPAIRLARVVPPPPRAKRLRNAAKPRRRGRYRPSVRVDEPRAARVRAAG